MPDTLNEKDDYLYSFYLKTKGLYALTNNWYWYQKLYFKILHIWKIAIVQSHIGWKKKLPSFSLLQPQTNIFISGSIWLRYGIHAFASSNDLTCKKIV